MFSQEEKVPKMLETSLSVQLKEKSIRKITLHMLHLLIIMQNSIFVFQMKDKV